MIELNDKEIAVIFLGTGSAAPTLQRRLPSTVVLHRGSMVMFDAGEGTQIQFRKHRLRFNRLEYLCISHLHGDHVTGIIGMLMSMELQNRIEPLTIYGPPGIRNFIETTRQMLNTYFSFSVTIHETDGGTFDLGEHVLTARPLQHRIFCLGYRLEEKKRPGTFFPENATALNVPQGPLWGQLQKGFSVELTDGTVIKPEQVTAPPLAGRVFTYCTDTRPCQNAVILAQNADILVFDSTFAAGEEKKAAERGHSSAQEALDVACQAGTKHLALSHISARYNNIRDLIGDTPVTPPPAVSVARDLDIVIIPWTGNVFRRY